MHCSDGCQPVSNKLGFVLICDFLAHLLAKWFVKENNEFIFDEVQCIRFFMACANGVLSKHVYTNPRAWRLFPFLCLQLYTLQYVNNPFSEFFYEVRVFGELHFSRWTSSGSVDICSKAILPPLKGFCNLVNKVFLSISIHKYFLSMLLWVWFWVFCSVTLATVSTFHPYHSVLLR